ncbi:MAG TPA: hypothetical protein VHK00_02710 [Miltoncostaeaceae bacterium]|jgi:hypothetical protein|nr:hypothetical protein [Miltoncostaeaceae bacterium]
MDPGDILSRTWELYRAHWRHFIAIAAVIYVPLGAVSAGLALIGWPGVLAGNILNLAAIFLVQGALVTAVEDVRDGRRDRGVADTLRHAGGRLVALTVAGLLAALGILAGLTLLIVPGLVLLTWWLVVSPVIMLECCGVAHGFGRSRALVRGNSWPVFGVVVLTMLVLLAFSLALGLALTPLGGATRGFLQAAVGHTVAAPFAAVAWTLTYFRLRDIEDRGAPAGLPPPAPAG